MKFLVMVLFFVQLSLALEVTNENSIPAEVTAAEKLITTETSAKESVETSITTTAAKVATNKSEEEIPLNLESKKNAVANESPFFKFIFFVGILGTLLAGAWIFVKRYNTKNIAKNHNEIKILAQHYLGPKKSLAVVRVAGESILVGITDNNINLIKSLALLDEEIPEVTPSEFNKLLKSNERLSAENVKDHIQVSAKAQPAVTKSATYNRAAAKVSMEKSRVTESVDIEEDEFSIKGIKDIVSSKLKNMRSI